MVFPTVEFAVFFPIVLALSWALMPYPKWWKPFILAVSYVFYAAADPKFCLLLGGVTLANQAGAVLVERTASERRRNAIVAIVVAIDLGVLAVFKYYGFFATEWSSFLRGLGLGSPLPLLQIALPVGLSFFTFQAISYIVDVRRGLCERAKTIDLGIYLSFFPHLVAGPIVRAREFLPQLDRPRNPRDVAVGAGIVLIGMGLIKKVLVADYLARHAVDPVFAVPETYGAPDVWFAVFAYAIQIYCDFSGYTDIAIGLALLMGFVFPQNFNRPYRALSFRDFWQRWHITLSRYLRDFLYIPLGGNRHGRWRTATNLMVTMLLGGLWHGAAWGFILWGAIHGAALVIEHQFRGKVSLTPVISRAVVLIVVVLAWIPFRATDLSTAWVIVQRLFAPGPATLLTPAAVFLVAVVFVLQWLPDKPLHRIRRRFEALDPASLGLGLAATILVVAATVPGSAVPPFIYFQF